MDNVGAEVGQKMRSAIKAKLQELGCYVDDELPDYIMVMVANKRTENQMKEDLKLFLTTKTSAFVDWLQIVLKKLKEVTVTNPEVYKKVAKRKSDEKAFDVKVKKEKKDKKDTLKLLKVNEDVEPTQIKSLTDDLPIEASKLAKKRKIVVVEDKSNATETVDEDVFDIPPLSAVTTSNETELLEIESKIASVKNRLGLHIPSESDDDFITIRAEPDDAFSSEQKSHESDNLVKNSRKVKVIDENDSPTQHTKEKTKHARIVFEKNSLSESPQKSIYKRLGRKNTDEIIGNNHNNSPTQAKVRREKDDLEVANSKSNKENGTVISMNSKQYNKTPNLQRESALKRLGVKSKISIPEKPPKPQVDQEKEELELMNTREVPSAIKIKPRVIPPSNVQPNKNLLLKAVAEAQRSIAQTPIVGTNLSPKSLIANRTNKNVQENDIYVSDDDSLEYVPKPLKRNITNDEERQYIPTFKDPSTKYTSNTNDINQMKTTLSHRFVITLDGIDKNKCKEIKTIRNCNGIMAEEIQLQNRKNSPIVYQTSEMLDIPDILPIVYQSGTLKTKERCKYWPVCNKGEKCEYTHPNTLCKNFPRCKFGEKCLYLHPPCKFESSCTKKDCPFSHLSKNYNGLFLPSQLQQCKFFPSCTNPHCPYYHPRPCRFGKFCKNKSECNFLHNTFVPSKQSLTWKN